MIDCAAFVAERRHVVRVHRVGRRLLGRQVGQMICWSTIGGSVFDPELSRVSDTVDVAVLPADEGQTPRAVRGGWGLGHPREPAPGSKDVAWHLLTYLTSKELEQYQVLHVQDRSQPQLDVQGARPRRGTPLPARRRRRPSRGADPRDGADPGELRARRRGGAGVQPRPHRRRRRAEEPAPTRRTWVAILQRGGHLA